MTANILRSLVTGLSLGLIVVAALWMLAKFSSQEPDFISYCMIGGGVALAVFAVMFLIGYPTNKRLAKRLDQRLGLDEKVQTMLAFRKDESEMAALQRSSTNQILLDTPGKHFRSKNGWMAAILPVIACVCIAVTVLVPVDALDDPDNPDNTSWFLNVYDEQKLKDLIEYVRTSNMQPDPRQGIVTELEDLRNQLKGINKKVTMEETVLRSISDIHDIAGVCNTYGKITDAMKNTPSESVRQLGINVRSLDDSSISHFLKLQLESMTGEGSVETAAVMASGLRQALTTSKEEPTNAIYMALDAFAAELETAADGESLKTAFANGEKAINAAVRQPGIDLGVEKYTISRLMTIFGISAENVPEDILAEFESSAPGEQYDPDEEEEDKSDVGGLGNGLMVYGSDDTIYDPDLEQFVTYGEVLDKYQAIITEYLNDGSLTPEQEEIINDYFALLYRVEQEEN